MTKLNEDLLFILKDTVAKGKQALVFMPTKSSAEASAENFAKELVKKPKKARIEKGSAEQPERTAVAQSSEKEQNIASLPKPELEKLSEDIHHALSAPTKQCEKLSECIKQGIAFHHSGLVSKQRHLIEENFRNNKISLIFCTPTLAMGMDLPAFRTVITSLRRYGNNGYQWIPVMEYLQMAGRAGRKGKEKYGESIVIAKSEGEKEAIVDKFLTAPPEPIYSKLAVEPVFRTYLLALISMNFVNTIFQIQDFFNKTFFAQQYSDESKLNLLIERQLGLLESYGFIQKVSVSGDDAEKESNLKKNDLFESAINLITNRKRKQSMTKYIATPLGSLVAKLYLDPYSAHMLIRGLSKARITAEYIKHNPFTFIVVLSQLLELRPLPSINAKDEEELEALILNYGDSFLLDVPLKFDVEYYDFLKSLKMSKIINDWLNEIDEDVIMEKHNVRPGELKAKLEIIDWLLYSSTEIAKLLNFKELVGFLVKLRMRLEYGIKDELMNLIRLKNIGKKRARTLFNRGYKTVNDITEKDLSAISGILGNAVAKDVFKQLGFEVLDVDSADKKTREQIVMRKTLLDY